VCGAAAEDETQPVGGGVVEAGMRIHVCFVASARSLPVGTCLLWSCSCRTRKSMHSPWVVMVKYGAACRR
jgi:hypothetical protein